MQRLKKYVLIGITSLMLLACDQQGVSTVSDNAEVARIGLSPAEIAAEPGLSEYNAPKLATEKWDAAKFKTIEWTDLMPKHDYEALINPPSYVTDVEDGSIEDQITNQIKSSVAAAKDDDYQKALVSTSVVEDMNGKAIRIPGFIVPLEFDDDQTITQFFLVPFFGACIHVPPPPPNQIIFVNYPKGLKLNALYDPFWISGIVTTSLVENDIATSSYSLLMLDFEPYNEN